VNKVACHNHRPLFLAIQRSKFQWAFLMQATMGHSKEKWRLTWLGPLARSGVHRSALWWIQLRAFRAWLRS